MDLQGILQNLLGNHISTIRTSDGNTYGPAVSRVTRTPISYGTLPANRSGEYYPDSDSIKIDPTKGNVGAVTRHESIHALLQRLPNGGASETSFAPGFMDIARRMQGMVQGNMQDEVPAYMAQSPTSGFYGISNEQRNAYVNGLAAQLHKLDPSIAERFQRLSGAK